MACKEEDIVYSSDDASCSTPVSAELFCDSCIQDGDELIAEGYCVDCGHHLCSECFKIHRIPRPLRHHQLLQKHEMPMLKSTTVPKDECNDRCRVHEDEVIKYFCKDHDEVGCTVCVTLGHRTCDVQYIPTLAKHLFDNPEYKTFKRSLKSLSNRVSRCTDFATTSVRSIINDTDRSTTEIHKRRKELNDFFDKLERETEGELQQSKSTNMTKIVQLLSACNNLEARIQEVQEDLNNKEERGNKCRLFVDMKLTKKEVQDEYKKEVDDIENGTKLERMSYIPSREIIEILSNPSLKLGTFIRSDGVVRVSKSKVDLCDMILLTNDRLVAIDNNANNCAIVLNIEQKQVTHSKPFPESVLGLTRVADTKFAAWHHNMIGMYSTEGEIQQQDMKECPGLQWPIVYSNNRFIGFTESTPHVIMITDADGNEIKTSSAGEDGKKSAFDYPLYVAVNQDNTMIYVSDYGAEIVQCLTMDGELTAEFRPQCEWCPRGIAVSRDGTVYVADFMNHNIHVLTPELKEVGVINGDMFGIKYPFCIAYCDTNRKLYVGMFESKNIVVLKV